MGAESATRCRQRGSYSVFATLVLLFGIALLLFGLVVSEAMNKRGLVQDLSGALARIALANQLSYRTSGGEDTPTLLRRVLGEGGLSGQLGSLGEGYAVTYQFGNSDGSDFVPINDSDPDPGSEHFNAVALQVDANIGAVGYLQRLLAMVESPLAVTGRAIYRYPDDPHDPDDGGSVRGCYCEAYCTAEGDCPASGGLLGLNACNSCLTGCDLGFVLGTLLGSVLNLLFTLQLETADLLTALMCLLQSVERVLVDVWNWVFTPGHVILR